MSRSRKNNPDCGENGRYEIKNKYSNIVFLLIGIVLLAFVFVKAYDYYSHKWLEKEILSANSEMIEKIQNKLTNYCEDYGGIRYYKRGGYSIWKITVLPDVQEFELPHVRDLTVVITLYADKEPKVLVYLEKDFLYDINNYLKLDEVKIVMLTTSTLCNIKRESRSGGSGTVYGFRLNKKQKDEFIQKGILHILNMQNEFDYYAYVYSAASDGTEENRIKRWKFMNDQERERVIEQTESNRHDDLDRIGKLKGIFYKNSYHPMKEGRLNKNIGVRD